MSSLSHKTIDNYIIIHTSYLFLLLLLSFFPFTANLVHAFLPCTPPSLPRSHRISFPITATLLHFTYSDVLAILYIYFFIILSHLFYYKHQNVLPHLPSFCAVAILILHQ